MKHKGLSILAAGAIVATSLTPLANVSAWTVSPEYGSAEYYYTRQISGVSGPVTAGFTYTITPLDTNPASVTGTFGTVGITFDNTAPTNGKVSASEVINFSEIVFSEIGDYGFTIRETESGDPINYPVSTDSYTAWVSVRNEVDNNNVPTGNHTATLVGVTNASGNKVEAGPTNNAVVFRSGAVRTYVSIEKSVTGNSADRDECFDIAVNFAGSATGTYTLDTASTCANNPATVAASGSTTIHLKHGESATIGKKNDVSEILIGQQYSATESGATDYKTYIDGSTTDSKTSATKTTVAQDNANFGTNNKISFVNNKEVTPRTGVMLTILPFVLIAMIGTFGAFFVARSKKASE